MSKNIVFVNYKNALFQTSPQKLFGSNILLLGISYWCVMKLTLKCNRNCIFFASFRFTESKQTMWFQFIQIQAKYPSSLANKTNKSIQLYQIIIYYLTLLYPELTNTILS